MKAFVYAALFCVNNIGLSSESGKSGINALEIVDNQHRVVFREQYVNTNTIQIQGTIVFQHYTLSTQDTGSITVGLNAGFDVSDFYLPPIFQYPSIDHKGERAK
jgi:hypothetical protein